MAVTSNISKNKITISARIFSLDGNKMIEESKTSIIQDAENLGKDIGKSLIKMGALKILKL